MKKTLLILFVAVISLTACKKDPVNKLSGRWDAIKDYSLHTIDGVKISEETHIYKMGDNYIVFDGNKYTMYEDGRPDDEGTFTATENSITLSDSGGDTETMSLRWNSNNEVVFYEESSETSNGIKSTSKYESTLRKH